MADALDLGSSSVRSAGSSPVSCTILYINELHIKIYDKFFLYFRIEKMDACLLFGSDAGSTGGNVKTAVAGFDHFCGSFAGLFILD